MTRVKITGLWKKETKAGKAYLSGKWGNVNIVIFQNSYKKEDKHPDYEMYLSEPFEKKEVPVDALLPQAGVEPMPEDSIPF